MCQLIIQGIYSQLGEPMSKFSYILAEFSKLGYNDSVKLNQYELNAALDKIIQHNMVGIIQFQRDIALELFEQTKRDNEGCVLLRDLIGVILQAHTVLEKHINNLKQELQVQTNQEKKQEIRGAIYQFEEDLRILTEPFHLHTTLPSRTSSQKRLQLAYPVAPTARAGPVAQVGLQKSGILDTQVSDGTQRQSLVWVLIIAGLALPFELLDAFVKNNFLNIMAVVMVLSIFLLNYFDKLYIRACIVFLAISVLLDLFWLIGLAGTYWNPVAPTHRSTLGVGFLRYTVVMTIILMLVRLIIGALIYKYKSNKVETRKIVRLGPVQFDLSGDGSTNPLSVAFSKKHEKMGGNLY